MSTRLDYVIVPAFLAFSMVAPAVLQGLGVPDLVVTPLVVGPMAAAAWVLERLRPERLDHVPLDQPLVTEVLHFLFNFELGYGVSLLACEGLGWVTGRALPGGAWPGALPAALQVFLAIVLYEATSYWQHRFIHRFAVPWRFHALHHSGGRLNLPRVVRFHMVDIGTASFAAYVPLVVLQTPESVVTRMVAVLGALGILQHANIRMRTPAWLDRVICTPAVHRLHHSRVHAESDRNFGNTVMLFDQLFGTWRAPVGPVPARVGIEDDPVPRGFWPQLLAPFRGG
jgi:sterol desaturase/sphingolipid hydroxylase (fatty acid hydroxylase superfamily)